MSNDCINSNLNSITMAVRNQLGSDTALTMSMQQRDEAVVVQNACKAYEFRNPILNKLNMTVERGTIYGLLGSSGCGKTTILSCIVGLKKLDSGNIRIFGQPPGTKENGILLGFMPQEIALYDIFTIKEMLQYFGRIYGMTQIEITARMEFLVNFLDLPECSRLIGTLSGGQQRRTSLAVAMIHQPELLLLDEPTVGVDPLLRESIWRHLCELVAKRKTTIIITTHYLEDIKFFNKVGLMRNGRLLVEGSPFELFNDYATNKLNDVILKLCKTDSLNNNNFISESSFCCGTKRNYTNIISPKNSCQFCDNRVIGISYERNRNPSGGTCTQGFTSFESADTQIPKKSVTNNLWDELGSHLNKIRSVTIRNFLTLFRTPWFLFAITLIPALQVILGNFIVGRVPKFTAIGVVNNDVHATDLLEFCKRNTSGCLTDNISCKFLNLFPPEEINWVSYSTEQEALKNVENGNTWGYISIPHNYTEYIRDRSLVKNFIGNTTLDGTTILSRLDESFSLKTDFLKTAILMRFQQFMKEVVSDCNLDPRSMEIPLNYNAIYGSPSVGFREYILPPQLILIIFLLPMASSLVHIRDQKNGTMARSLIAGVSNVHYLVAFIISEGSLIIVQLSICFGVLVFGFNFQIVGSSFIFMLILFVQGITGLSVGFCVASFCNHELELVLCLIGLYMPIMVASGATWPLESLNKWGRLFCSSLPTTLPIEGLRSVVSRNGWGITHPHVYGGFVVMAVWILGAWILTEVVRRIRNR